VVQFLGPITPNGTSSTLRTVNIFADATPICAEDQAASYYLRARSQDNVGWQSEWGAYTLAYDGAPPTATLRANYSQPTVHQTSVHLDILGNDEGSGVDRMRLSNDARAWTDWLDFQAETYWQIPSVGRRT